MTRAALSCRERAKLREDTMFGFKKASLSTPERGRIFEQAAQILSTRKGEAPSLRVLVAETIGSGTSPDSQQITGLLKDLLDYADFRAPRPSDSCAWWDGASHEQRLSALTTAAAGMK